MTSEIRELINEYNSLLDYQEFNPDNLDYRLLDYHFSMLHCLDVVDNSCISVFDLYQKKHVYYSSKFSSLLGWDSKRAEADIEYTNSLIHPDDLPSLYRAGIYYISLGFSIGDRAVSRNYKSIFEYRVRGKQSDYVRVIEQQVPLEYDKSGNVWLALSMLDISPDQDIEAPFRGRLKNQVTGELFTFPPENDQIKTTALTTRQKEILNLISKGLISKQIADKLFISVNTVNTHRQRIIEKLNVSNTYEAIKYAHERGILS